MQVAELERRLGKDISDVDRTLEASILEQVHASAECLQAEMDMHSYLISSSSSFSNKPPPSELDSDTDPNPSTNPKMMKEAYRRLF